MQVLYLDSIDVGSLNISHDTFPRIRHFTAEIMKTMIMADTIPGKLEARGFEFGKSQVRRTAMYVVYINKNEQKIEVLCIQISNMLYLKKFLHMTVQRKKYSLLLREKSTVCYSWATNLQPPSGTPSSSTTVGLWELASSFPRILGVHPVVCF